MTDQLTFIHLSDIHLNPASSKNIYNMGINREEKFTAVLQDIKQRKLNPDFFIISGDLIHEGTSADYRMLRKRIEEKEKEFGVPFFVCLGNHDEREAFWQGYQGEENRKDEYYYTATVHGLRLIFLDSKFERKEEGVISPEQLDWLKNELDTPCPGGTLIILHHPLMCTPFDFMAYSILQNTDDLMRVIDGKDVLAVLSGHVHFTADYQVGGILNAVIASVSYGIDCSDPGLHKFMDDSTYGIVHVSHRQVMVQPWSLPADKAVKYQLPVK